MEQSQAIKSLSPEVKSRAVEASRPAAALMDRATSHHNETSDASSNRVGGNGALIHTQGAPGKTQESLSPTDGHKGQTQSQRRAQERGRGMER